MSNITPFEFEKLPIRVVQIDGEPWFVGKDVAEVLGYKDTTNAMKQHCRGVVKHHPILDSLGRTQEARILAEPDVLRLIVSSKLSAAERFESWVFDEVLPTIRKTGSYGMAPANDPMAVLNDPAAMRGLLLNYTEKVIALEGRVQTLAPKAEALDRIASTDGSLCLTDAAKTLQVNPRKLTNLMQSLKWIYRRPMGGGWLAYQDRIQQGMLEHKMKTGEKSDGSEWSSTQVRVTPKGMAKLSEIINRDGLLAA